MAATINVWPPAAGGGGTGDGVSAGASGDVQYSDGAAGFLGVDAFHYDAVGNTVAVGSVTASVGASVGGTTATAAGLAVWGGATAAAQRTSLGLGTISTQASSAVAITGGTVVGITDLAVADGGTGASTAANARTNLGISTVGNTGAASDLTGLAAVATSGLASDLSGTLAAARLPAMTGGDVTSSAGSASLALGNIPTATTMAGSVLATNIAAPSTPASGHASVYVDSTSLNLAVKDSAGTVKHGVQTKAAVTSNFVTAISDAGVVSVAQPAASDVTGLATVATSGSAADLTGTLAAARLPALSGDVTSSAGSAATAISGHAVTNAMLRQSTALTVIGRSANSTGDVADIATSADGDVLRRSGTTLGFGGVAAAAMPALTGDVTTSAGAVATTIAAAAVTLAKMANLAAATIIGRAIGAGTGVPTALTPAQALAMLTTEVNDGNLGATFTLDWTTGINHRGALTANLTYTFTAPAWTGARLLLRLTQDSTARTITWPGTVKWPGGTIPTIPTASGAVFYVAFAYDGTNYNAQGGDAAFS